MGLVTAAHVVDPVYPGAVDEIVNLGNHWDQELLRESKEEIKALTGQISAAFATAYDFLEKSKKVYDELCLQSNLNLDATALEQASKELIQKVFYGDLAKTKNFFASAITPLGLVGYGQEISASCKTRFILDGGASFNVSAVLNKVVEEAQAKGHNLNLYHNPMEPDSLEIVVIPDLSVALLNSGAPGLEPKQGDILIELYPKSETTPAETQALAEDLGLLALEKERQCLFAEANSQISNAKALHNRLEEFYIKAMDFEGIDLVAKEVFAEIWAMAAAKEKLEQRG